MIGHPRSVGVTLTYDPQQRTLRTDAEHAVAVTAGPQPALDGLDLSVEAGEVYSCLGSPEPEDGYGKLALARLDG